MKQQGSEPGFSDPLPTASDPYPTRRDETGRLGTEKTRPDVAPSSYPEKQLPDTPEPFDLAAFLTPSFPNRGLMRSVSCLSIGEHRRRRAGGQTVTTCLVSFDNPVPDLQSFQEQRSRKLRWRIQEADDDALHLHHHRHPQRKTPPNSPRARRGLGSSRFRPDWSLVRAFRALRRQGSISLSSRNSGRKTGAQFCWNCS